MVISILQWNIWYLEDIKNVLSCLKEVNADIICLQELSIDFDKQNHIHIPNYIAKELGYNLYFQEITFAGQTMKLANAIFSRYPLSDTKTIWINKESGTGNYDDENRAYVEAAIDVGGKRLTIGTVHMSYTHAFEPSVRKLNETDALVEAIQDHKNNFILTGDFNAHPISEVIHKIEQHVKNCGPEYTENTWTTKPFSYNGFETKDLDWRLDYVFGSDDIKVQSSKVLDTPYSDHLPIVVTVEL